ncbi:MAG: aminoacyl-tRNA hydrolase [Anaerolineae bacterium]|nr:aminoacyl-tRNA hydrolase [Anaerolineae bacterium]MDW8068815.1 aminoacyl-tRNA hydrolase [Anaerolineae bacterium]
MYLIVGLGNPGVRYARNRHNVGARCVFRMATVHGLEFSRRQKNARVAQGRIGDIPVLLAIPQTFMNESGRAVAPLARLYQVPLEHLLVVHDDLDLPPGTLRLRPDGGDGGHRGMRSIIEHLGTQHFPRLRIGIGRPPGHLDPADYVLQDFAPNEEAVVEATIERAIAAIRTWLTEGLEKAMSQYNR